MTMIDAQLAPAENGQAFRALIALVGVETSDGRVFDALTWREPPLTVYSQMTNANGHDEAPIVGRIDRVERNANEVWGFGMLDTGSDAGRETIRLIREQFLRGVSVDAAVLDMTESNDGLTHFVAEVGALTIVGFPAFRETEIELVSDSMPDEASVAANLAVAFNVDLAETQTTTNWPEAPDLEAQVRADVRAGGIDLGPGLSLIASARPQGPPREWFADPRLDRRRGLHVEADGRIWGHVYGWGECHVGSPPGRCVQLHADALGTDMISDIDGRGVLCDDGSFVRTGPLVIAADHADLALSWHRAKDHYANTALAVGDVTIGFDAYGIWCAGAVRPGSPPELLHALRASVPSVDCRDIAGRLEVISLLAVNTGGFPARHVAARLAEGRVLALVASGAMVDEDCGCGEASSTLTDALERLASLERDLSHVRLIERQTRENTLAEIEVELGLDRASEVAALEADLLV